MRGTEVMRGKHRPWAVERSFGGPLISDWEPPVRWTGTKRTAPFYGRGEFIFRGDEGEEGEAGDGSNSEATDASSGATICQGMRGSRVQVISV